LPARTRALRGIGLALAACEKAAQIVYEFNLRPAEKTHAPWVDRVHGQLRAAVDALEAELPTGHLPADAGALTQADLTLAVAWGFIQLTVPERVPAKDYPRLAAFAAAAEQLDVFRETPIE
jgi:hypothetical protein